MLKLQLRLATILLLLTGAIYGNMGINEINAGSRELFNFDYTRYIPVILSEDTWGGYSSDYGRGLAVDTNGSIYLIGESHSFCCGTPTGFILKLDSAGTPLWQWNLWGSGSYGYATSIAVNQAGIAYVTGHYYNTSTSHDVFILALNSTGGLLWGKTWSTLSYDDTGRAVIVDPFGDIYVVAATSRFSLYTLLLLKFSSNGSLLWQKIWHPLYNEVTVPQNIAVDLYGNIYVAGNAQTFESGRQRTVAFLFKINPTGDLQWRRYWGLGDYSFANAVGMDPSGNVVVAGRDYGSSGTSGIPILKFDSAGEILWQIIWPVGVSASGNGLVIDGQGAIYLTGETGYFGSAVQGILLAEFDPSRVLDWGAVVGAGIDRGAGISIDSVGNLVIIGTVNANPQAKLTPMFQKVTNASFTFLDLSGTLDDNVQGEATQLYANLTFSTLGGNLGYGGLSDAYILRVRPPTPTAPAPPYALVAKSGESDVTLSWAPPDFNGASAIRGYRIFRGDANGTERPYANITDTLSYVDTAVNPGATYFYYVTAVNSAGQSAPSNRASAQLRGLIPIDFLQPPFMATVVGAIAVVSLIIFMRRRSRV